ncbi:dephospho-CoA kinase [Oceanobacillus sp. CAU 1775]
MSLIIGLTGSIATGKSTVSAMFESFNIPVIDADKIAREVVNPGEPASNEIRNTFGAEVFHEDGTLNRERLGQIIFADQSKRSELNAIIHPAIRKRMLEKKDALLESGEECIVFDIPLLFESKLEHFVDKIIVVSIDEKTQLSRLMARDTFTEEEAKQRIASQMPVSDKEKLADAVINNNGTKEESHNQLTKILQEWDVKF